MENKQWLSSTNEYGILGLKFLYISNAGAIIALLANVNNFVDEEDYPTIARALNLFVWGLLFALISTFFGYLIHRVLVFTADNNKASKKEWIFGAFAICAALTSFIFFAFGAHQAISIIEYAL